MAFILASKSPRRKEILTDMGIDFDVIVSDADESSDEKDPVRFVELLAEKKAFSVASLVGSDDIILAADTVVVLEDNILGKPKSKRDAENMLTMLSGNVHRVITGVCIKRGNRTQISHDITYVYFKTLTKNDIKTYLSLDEYKDKAGSYAIQGIAGRFVSKIEGSFTNVVGLPKELVKEMLDNIK